MGDFPGHEKLQGVLCAGVIAKIDQSLIDDLCPGFGRDVAAQVDVELAGDLEIVRRPGIALRVEQVDAAAAGDGDQRIGLCSFSVEFRRLEMEPRKAADDFKMAEFLGPDIHEEILAVGVLTIQALNGVLHRGGQLAVGAAELFEQHVAKARIGFIDPHGVHELLDVMIHDDLGGCGDAECTSSMVAHCPGS